MASRFFSVAPDIMRVLLICLIPYVVVLMVEAAGGNKKRLASRHYYLPEYCGVVYAILLARILGFLDGSWSFTLSPAFNMTFFVSEDPALMLYNAIAFIPMGFFLPAIFKPLQKFWKTALVGLVCSVTVELTQAFFLGRIADVDDLFFNTVGCCAGYALFWVGKIIVDRNERLLSLEGLSLLFEISSVVWLLPVRGHSFGTYIILLANSSITSVPPSLVLIVGIGIALIGLLVGRRCQNSRVVLLGRAASIVSICFAVAGIVKLAVI